MHLMTYTSSHLALRLGSKKKECPDLPIGYCNLPLHDRQTTTRTNFRVRILVGCDGLEADASRFRRRMNGTAPGDSTCKLHLRTPPTLSSCTAPPSPPAAVNYS